MAVILWAMGLSLLMQGCLCSLGQTARGCMKWKQDGNNVCCEACYPGHHLVKTCGQSPKDLCVPCEPGTYTLDTKPLKCNRCTQCIGVQVLVKSCTATSNTQCGCKDGLTCGDNSCSFCTDKCDKGYEPTKDRSCRPCPEGTFNDQIHQMCKPWSTKCPNADQHIIAKGNAVNDIKCANVTVRPSHKPVEPDMTEATWIVLSVVTCLTVMGVSIVIIAVALKLLQKKPPKPDTKTPIIRTPTDDPRTLIAIECSFHEAQQEQGSSSESLDSKDSSDQLIA
ncbi:tumor necrosis factor receptor superfamily member 9a [Lates calcarifer]|uniref:Tumor necrosis factor receptor superfamily member 9a n=1 Tax=Lates calcarifer TaxID=8187 RepID=A0A4W6DLQ5_LATCA|nr:tumor necrosis factor receptor superfamily member 9a [Lates calcarifer]